jgi:hypothetical protein
MCVSGLDLFGPEDRRLPLANATEALLRARGVAGEVFLRNQLHHGPRL